MSIGLPVHLATYSVGRAFMRASHAGAWASLSIVVLSALMIQVESPSLILWAGIISLLPMFFLLWLVGNTGSLVSAAIYLVVGGVAVYFFSVAVYASLPGVTSSTTFLFVGAALPLILVAPAGIQAVPAVSWAVAGYVVGLVSIGIASTSVGVGFGVEPPTLIALVVSVVTVLVLAANQRRVRFVTPTLHRAARDERLSDIRLGLESRAAAVLHDTVLNHLATIGSSPRGPSSPDAAAHIANDLEQLIGQEWLAEVSGVLDSQDAADWASSRLSKVIEEVRRLGLEVDVNGDLTAVASLDSSRATAVALAAKQCLVNVVRHADASRAEVVIIRSESDVTVMIVDSGRGFAPDETRGDRLGLRQSVRNRVESVDGDVRVWSAPGRGTSVLIRVPIASPAPPSSELRSGE